MTQVLSGLRFQLALLRAPRIGPRGFKALIDCYGSAKQVFAAPLEELAGQGLGPDTLAWLKSPDWSRVDDDLHWLESPKHHCLCLHDADYPPLLQEIADPPPVLFVIGDPKALTSRQLAVVGSRNPSSDGERLAFDFARALTACGLSVTSGLALGIDGAAHRGALDGGGLTLAVAGTGLDQVYPRRHDSLAQAIVEQGGALVSEFPAKTPPLAGNFPRRNRIISGLSLGVLVVEASLRSGSLITARMALEQGREVFALPGSIHNPLARGCNALIKQGAKLVETVDDILEELNLEPRPLSASSSTAQPVGELTDDCRLLLKSIAYAPTSVDTLVAATGMAPEAVASMLLLLELRGLIVSAAGGYSRIR